MQTPLVVFDHIKKAVAIIGPGPEREKQLAELAQSQREQIATSGRPAAA